MSTLLLIAGLVVLTVGADLLVRAASSLALAMKISPLVIGLTIVAFGTSAPELVVSLQSSLAGQPDIALGNVVGSNIFNVLFILGVSALITPLIVAQQLVRFDVPLMIGLSALMLLMGADGAISRVDGGLLVLGLIGYTTYAIRCGRKESAEVTAEYVEAIGEPTQAPPPAARLIRDIVVTMVGLGLLVFGSRLFVSGAIDIARGLGVSELVIGLTLVAAGTSLPEVATSLVAAWKGERDIAVGNVVGSNIFNILGVLGAAGVASGTGVAVSPAAFEFDLPVMLAVAVACLPVFFTGHLIARWEGVVFLLYYIFYVAHLAMASTGHTWIDSFQTLLLWMVIPLTVLTLIVGLIRELQSRRPAS